MIGGPTVIILAALLVFGLWQAYRAGHQMGFWQGSDAEGDRWRERLGELRRERTVERANGEALQARHARQRLRLRGVLREARRWKAAAVALGWARPTAALARALDTRALPVSNSEIGTPLPAVDVRPA